MDFIEQLFGFSPDGGSGVVEFLLLAIPVVAVSMMYWTRFMRSKRNSYYKYSI
jgi:hypothetical protein